LNQKKEFVFPMNYKNKEKFLGVIDYKTFFAILVFSISMFFVLKSLQISLMAKVCIFIIVVGFFAIMIAVGINGENMLEVLYFLIKYFMKERVYVYRKSERERRYKICENLLRVISQ